MTRNKYNRDSAETFKKEFRQYSIQELLVRQSKGKFLTIGEKEQVKQYAEEKRKERLNS
jgi:hypothetical protein